MKQSFDEYTCDNQACASTVILENRGGFVSFNEFPSDWVSIKRDRNAGHDSVLGCCLECAVKAFKDIETAVEGQEAGITTLVGLYDQGKGQDERET